VIIVGRRNVLYLTVLLVVIEGTHDFFLRRRDAKRILRGGKTNPDFEF